MDQTVVLLSPIQFASTVSFHIIFPAFTVGLGARLTVLVAMWIAAAAGLPPSVGFLSITIADAAAPYSSQVLPFWGAGLVALPSTLIYTLVVHFVFKDKTAVEPLLY